jgi:hypothetical protein
MVPATPDLVPVTPDPLGGTLEVNNGVLQANPVESGFWTTEEAVFIHTEGIDGDFLAVALVQPLDSEDETWPDERLNLAGLVVRDGNCSDASNCGLWTKFEVGTGPANTEPHSVFASSRDDNAGTPPVMPMDYTPEPLGLAPTVCPPPILVGLCGQRSGQLGATLSLQGYLRVLGGMDSTATTSEHSWPTTVLGGTAVDVGLVAAAGYRGAGNDIRARFGIFAVYPVDAQDCPAAFEAVVARLAPPGRLEQL